MVNCPTLTCDQFSGLQEAYKFYIENHKIQPKRLAAAVACPVEHDQITLTNNQWGFSKSQLLADLCLEEALIINDFTAQSLAVVSLSPSSFETLNTGIPNLQEPIFVIGPGTGLGVGGLVLDADGEWTPLSTEGGHVTLAAQTEDEWDVLRILKSRFSHISAERVISGPGLLLLYQTLCTLHAKQPIADSTATMIAAVDQDPMIYRALAMFAGFFGGVASDGCLHRRWRHPKAWAVVSPRSIYATFSRQGAIQQLFISSPRKTFIGFAGRIIRSCSRTRNTISETVFRQD